MPGPPRWPAFGPKRDDVRPYGRPAADRKLRGMDVGDGLIPEPECWELLASASVGCIALSIRAHPAILPVQYYLGGRTLAVCLGHRELPERALSGSAMAIRVQRLRCLIPDGAFGPDHGHRDAKLLRLVYHVGGTAVSAGRFASHTAYSRSALASIAWLAAICASSVDSA
jgi:hypothetical protein